MKYCIGVLFSIVINIAFAQDDNYLMRDEDWNNGSVMLANGEELKGQVRYDDRNGVLAYKNGEDSRSFTPRTVAAFEYKDKIVGLQRIFITMVYEDPEDERDKAAPLFFELLREFKAFTVLARAEEIKLSQKRTQAGVNSVGVTITTTVIKQPEIVYIMKGDNQILPYIKTVSKTDDLREAIGQDAKTKERMLDRSLLADVVTEPIYEKLKQYAKQNDLSFKYKEDLLQILDYYKTLVK